MCFVIHSDYKEPLIADKDITCYKVLEEEKEKLNSPFLGEVYFIKNEEETEVTKEVPKFLLCDQEKITEGLHSTLESALILDFSREVYKAIIPKGTKYYYNPDDNEYVSLKLTVYKERILNEKSYLAH